MNLASLSVAIYNLLPRPDGQPFWTNLSNLLGTSDENLNDRIRLQIAGHKAELVGAVGEGLSGAFQAHVNKNGPSTDPAEAWRRLPNNGLKLVWPPAAAPETTPEDTDFFEYPPTLHEGFWSAAAKYVSCDEQMLRSGVQLFIYARDIETTFLLGETFSHAVIEPAVPNPAPAFQGLTQLPRNPGMSLIVGGRTQRHQC